VKLSPPVIDRDAYVAQMMRAVHQAGWGGREQLSVRDLPRPVPGVGSVLVRVMAVSIHAGDHHMLSGRPYLIRLLGRRDVPGMDFAGVVETVGGPAVGSSADTETVLAPGDHVLGTADVRCGAFAEFVCVPLGNVVLKPANVTWEEAAALPTSAETALQALRSGGIGSYEKVKSGHRVLINGGSGGVGSFAVQLAKHFGARVTAVCSTRNVDLVSSLGADEVIDYTKETIEGYSKAHGNVKYDTIIDAVGRYSWRHLLAPSGALVAVSLPNPETECVPCGLCHVACFSSFCCCCLFSRKSKAFMQTVSTRDLSFLANLVRDGKIRPALGLKLESLDAIPDALADHFDASNSFSRGHRVGKTVVTLSNARATSPLDAPVPVALE